MFSTETGPGRLFKSIRDWKGLNETLRDGIECLLCESVWWSAVITLWLYLTDAINWQLAPVFWLACSATACIIHFVVKSKEPNE